MNKLIVVLLAVCLVSVHAFVKRDAETPQNENSLEKYRKEIEDIAENLSDHALVRIKPLLNDLNDIINNALSDTEPKEEVKQ